MKTKPFLLATSGATIDGRTIDPKMLQEMASSYDPKTYSARLNIEHIRGISGDKPFRAYGDVLSLSTAEVEVDFNGKKEKRTGLYGVLDVTDDAKALNDANQKVFPSIEIEPDFAGKGFAYLAGCALTDSPAAIGTDRLTFNRALPGRITLTAQDSAIAGAAIEVADEVAAQDAALGAVAGFFTKLGEKMGFNTPATPAVTPPAPKVEDKPAAFDPAQFAKELGETMTGAFGTMSQAFNAQVEKLTGDVAALKQQIETTGDPQHQPRPRADGGAGTHAYSAADVF